MLIVSIHTFEFENENCLGPKNVALLLAFMIPLVVYFGEKNLDENI